jgi:hypothetical protein
MAASGSRSERGRNQKRMRKLFIAWNLSVINILHHNDVLPFQALSKRYALLK